MNIGILSKYSKVPEISTKNTISYFTLKSGESIVERQSFGIIISIQPENEEHLWQRSE
jgi:hypothetical protein